MPAGGRDQLTAAVNAGFSRLNQYTIEVGLDRAALRLLHRLAGLERDHVAFADLQAAFPDGMPEDETRQAAARLALKGFLLAVGPDGYYLPRPVSQSMRSGRAAASLRSCLERMQPDQRQQLARNLGLAPAGSEQYGLLPALFAALTDRESVCSIAGQLSPATHAVLDSLLAAGGQLPLAELLAAVPKARRNELKHHWAWHYGSGSRDNELIELQRRGLVHLPFGSYTPQFAVPEEIRDCLPPPPEDPAFFCVPSLEPSESQEVFLEHTGILADLVRTLVFLEQEHPAILKSGGFPKQARRRLAQRLTCREEDYDGFLLALLFGLGLVARRGGCFLPADKAGAWLSLDRSSQLTQLCQGWVQARDWHEGQPDAFALSPYEFGGFPGLRRLLPALCRDLPPRGATSASFGSVIEFAAPRLMVSIEEDGAWPIVFAQLLRALRWLGLAQTAGGAQPAIQPGWALGYVFDGRQQALSQDIVVQPNLEVIGPPDLALPLLRQLLRFTEASPATGAIVAKLTTASVRSGVECDLTAKDMLEFLEQHATKGVPQTVSHFIRDVAGQYGQIELGPAEAYLRTATPELMAELLGDRTLRGRLHSLSDTVALLAGADQAKVVAAIKQRGRLPRVIDRVERQLKPAARPTRVAYDDEEWLEGVDDDFDEDDDSPLPRGFPSLQVGPRHA